MPPHPLKHKLKNVYSRNNLPKMKYGTYTIKFQEFNQ